MPAGRGLFPQQLAARTGQRPHVLAALARGEAPDLGGPALSWLRRRELIDEGARLTIPVLGRFLIEAELA